MSVKKEIEEGTTIVRLGHVFDSPYGLACSQTNPWARPLGEICSNWIQDEALTVECIGTQLINI